eukprot:TRINITY_DN696_c0_g1_i1.p1 TRINITY_DN696_c0_g1~~TRINITY_DN696_c0_g1_i1.p1  ORF type:complete len:299 (-),score=106.82 TRINITY_DN696_c0_g1_i1:343-1206(-)
MARFEERDPRWLVEERIDGTNVNNWHWSEFNVTSLAKERLTGMLTGMVIQDSSDYHCKILKLEACTGEVTVTCRKGKLYIFYELDIKLNWKGNKVGESPCTGNIHMPEIETDDDDYEVRVSSTAQTADDKKLVEIVKKDGIPLIKEKIATFLRDLRKENEDKLLKGKKPEPVATAVATPAPAPIAAPASSSNAGSGSGSGSKKESSASKDTVTIKMKSKFDAPPHEVFNAHFDAPRLSVCTGSPCDIKPVEGSTFTMYGGHVQGKVVKIESTKKFVQQWRFKNWPEG